MTRPPPAVVLAALPGQLASAWLGIIAVMVIVFGAGGWESWSHGGESGQPAIESPFPVDRTPGWPSVGQNRTDARIHEAPTGGTPNSCAATVQRHPCASAAQALTPGRADAGTLTHM
jgi:hypothetical protein